MVKGERSSRTVYVPSAVSSFFEICDRDRTGIPISNPLQAGARGGGFIIEKGSKTRASTSDSLQSDIVSINGKRAPEASTTLNVVKNIRREYSIPFCNVRHDLVPPVGMGFGTSGSGALGVSIAISDLFDLNLTLSQAAAYAHVAEIESVTGLGTVISLASGSGCAGLVTEPGSFSIGRVDSLLFDHKEYTLVAACFGTISKSSILRDERKKELVNRYGRETLLSVLEKRTPESLLSTSRIFAEKTGIASGELLNIADRALEIGALGATQNMIGNAVHCLVERRHRESFLADFSKFLPASASIFESSLSQSGPYFV